MLEKNSVLAIVITYHPDSAFTARIQHLTGEVGEILVVDNHSNAASAAMLREASTRFKMRIIWNPENLGIAAALNIGFSHAIANGFKWALLFDQDTVPCEGMLKALCEVYRQFPENNRLAIIGSNYRSPETGVSRFQVPKSNEPIWIDSKVVITSGSLVSVNAFKVIGPFREDYFIDCIDLEYCLRARSLGYRVILALRPFMLHSIGRPETHRLLWKIVQPANHGPLRRYYMVRNHIALAREYFVYDPRWILLSLIELLKTMIVVCIYEDDKLTKIRYAVRGIRDGVFFAKNQGT